MIERSSWLIAGSAAIILVLGVAHLVFTFFGPKLLPRDPELKTRMQNVPIVVTDETTVWKAWVGFNASHSCALILFGLVYGYLSIAHGAFLSRSGFLLLLGLLFLVAYALLAKRYFFSVPFAGLLLANALYVLGLITKRA